MGARGVLGVAVLCAAAADGAFALHGVLAAHGRFTTALSAFVVASAVVACALAPCAVACALVFARVGSLARGVTRLVARCAGGHGPCAAFVIAVAFGVAAVRAAIVGRALASSLTPHLAAPAVVLASLALALVALAAALVVARSAGPVLVALEARVPALRRVTRGIVARLAVAAVVIVALDALLLREYVAAPAAFVLGAVLAASAPRRAFSPPRARRALAVSLAAAALATFAAPHAVAHLRGRARVSVAQRPPYGSLVLALARRLVDGDHDGYSPWFGGGDCDDHDPRVHPGARDVPGNGIDENCTGSDASAIPAPPAPAVARPIGLPERPNVVVVVVDALRPDRLGFAGNARAPSPHIDRFRASATWFRRAYTPAPSTRFALASLFTGLDVGEAPQRRGAAGAFELLPEADTLAEALDRRGYDRVGFTIAHVAARIAGIGQGFRVWTTAWHADEAAAVVGHTAARTTDAMLAYLGTAGARPFFLFAHYDCTHVPYARDPEHDFGPRPVDLYDGAIAHCDGQLGRLFAEMDARPDRERTVVVLMSDHGELLGEQGLEQHGSALFEPAVRATLLVRVPGLTGPATVDAPVSLTDLAPTIASLTGAELAPSSRAWSLLAFMGAEPPQERPIFLYVDDWRAGVHYEARGVVEGDLKLIRDLPSGAEQLFDVVRDEAESHDLRRRLPAARDRLRALLDGWE